MRGVACATLAVACVLAGACGNEPPAGSEKVERPSAVGDCLRPDPAREGGLLQAGCEGAAATYEITAIVEARGAGPYCPAGTDVVADGAEGAVSGGEIDAPVSVWCLRNLAPPHPGDPGAGGGELVPDDCFVVGEPSDATRGTSQVAEVPCTGGPAPQYRLRSTATRSEDCPAKGSTPIEVTSPQEVVLCAAAVTTDTATG
jgi:hypothetical protein